MVCAADESDLRALADSLHTTLSSALAIVAKIPRWNVPEPHRNADRDPISLDRVNALIEERRRRDDFFPGDLFADPAWDMLLELYAALLGQRRMTTSGLGSGAAVPPTTALRWIGNLEIAGLIIRESDRLDARRVFVSLSNDGIKSMEDYFHSNPQTAHGVRSARR